MVDELHPMASKLWATCLRAGLEEVDAHYTKALRIAVMEKEKSQRFELEVYWDSEVIWVYWEVWPLAEDGPDTQEHQHAFKWEDVGAAILLIKSLAAEHNTRALTAHTRGE